MGADNKNYSAGNRFSAVQLGVGIPLFSKAQRNKIAGARMNKQVAESNYAIGLQAMQAEYQAALLQYLKWTQTVQYFQKNALTNANTIVHTANLQLSKGSINYLEWVQLINQAAIVKNDYIESIRNQNESIIQLNYLMNQY